MTCHRTISLKPAIIVVVLTILAAPSSALANSLLSGYGGPGEGNQAILGSALVGGAGGGGGSSSGSSGSGSGGSAESTGSSTAPATGAGLASGGREAESAGSSRGGATSNAGEKSGDGQAAGRASGSRARSGWGGKTSGGGARAYPVLPRDDVSQTASGGSQALGLSTADFLYVLLVLGVLWATGVTTRRLAQAPTRPGGV